MKMKMTIAGLIAVAGMAVANGPVSAMPIGLVPGAGVADNVEQVRLVCDRFGRCFRTPGYGPRYGYGYAPRYGYGPSYGYGPRYGWDRRWRGGYGW